MQLNCHISHTSFPVLSLNTILWSRNAIKNVLKTESAVFPGTLFKGWVKRHPNEEWQWYPARGQLPHSPCFSEPDKSAQGSSVILCVAVEGDLSFSDKGSVLVNVRFHPRLGIYENWWHCVCSLPGYTTECKGLHNKTIHCAHAINFHPEDVVHTHDKRYFTQSFATVRQRHNRRHCSAQQFTHSLSSAIHKVYIFQTAASKSVYQEHTSTGFTINTWINKSNVALSGFTSRHEQTHEWFHLLQFSLIESFKLPLVCQLPVFCSTDKCRLCLCNYLITAVRPREITSANAIRAVQSNGDCCIYKETRFHLLFRLVDWNKKCWLEECMKKSHVRLKALLLCDSEIIHINNAVVSPW